MELKKKTAIANRVCTQNSFAVTYAYACMFHRTTKKQWGKKLEYSNRDCFIWLPDKMQTKSTQMHAYQRTPASMCVRVLEILCLLTERSLKETNILYKTQHFCYYENKTSVIHFVWHTSLAKPEPNEVEPTIRQYTNSEYYIWTGWCAVHAVCTLWILSRHIYI